MTPILVRAMLALGGSLAAAMLIKVTLTTALALAGARLARRSRAALRHALLVGAFALLLILPIAAIVAPAIRVSVPIASEPGVGATAVFANVVEASLTVPATMVTNGASTLAPTSMLSMSALLLAMWSIGTTVFLVPVVVGLWQVRSLRRSALPWTQGRLVVGALAKDAGLHRRVDVLLHESVPGPMTCGVGHPAIVLPADAPMWAPEHLHRAVVHEIEHVRRADWVSQCLARAVCALYWFHPFVWIAWRRLVLEAERACDDAVLRRGPVSRGISEDAIAYADQLLGLAERLCTARRLPGLAMANRADLGTRVSAVLDSRQRRGRAGVVAIGFICGATAVLSATMSPLRVVAEARPVASPTVPGGGPSTFLSQAGSEAAAAEPRFDAASIKPCEPSGEAGGRSGGAGRGFDASPGRINVRCLTIAEAIARAYVQFGNPAPTNSPSFVDPATIKQLVSGGPAWMYTDAYTIEANTSANQPPITLMGSMLRTLLEDRLRLKMHQAERQIPVYALTVAAGGFKLRPADPATCRPPDPNNLGRQSTPASGEKPLCANGVGFHGPNQTLTATGVTIERFARGLSGLIMDRPVIDQTGIEGQFTFQIEFAADESTRRSPLPPPDVLATSPAAQADVPLAPSIFTVVQRQLGLKLDRAQGSQGFLIVDHVERPSEN